jgi:hypothetical protein
MTARLRRLRARARALKAKWLRVMARMQRLPLCASGGRAHRCLEVRLARRQYRAGDRFERAEAKVREERAHG